MCRLKWIQQWTQYECINNLGPTKNIRVDSEVIVLKNHQLVGIYAINDKDSSCRIM